MQHIIFALSLIVYLTVISHFGDTTSFLAAADGSQTPKLSKYEQYKDFFRLTESNFTSKVLSKKDPWIIVIHDSDLIPTGWKTMAASLRGMVWTGLIHKTKDYELLSQLDLGDDLPSAVVYPYGTRKTKETHVSRVFSPIEAKNKALTSISDEIFGLEGDDVQDFFMDSFASAPSRFPALVISMTSSPDAVFKCLSLRFKRYFNFRKMVNPSNSDLSALGLQDVYIDMPAFAVLVTTDPVNPKVNAIFYNVEEMGPMNYPNLLRFLFHVNAEYRYVLPGDNMSDDRTVAQLLDILDIEQERFDFGAADSPGEGKQDNKHTEL